MAMTLKPKHNHPNGSGPEKPRSKNGTSILVKCEGFAHCFLRLQWCGGILEVMHRLREAIRQKRTMITP